MKILHIIPSYVPAHRYGGSVKATHELCRALVKKGQEILVITTNIDGPKNLDVPLNTPVDVDGVRVIYCPVRWPRFYSYSSALSRAIRERIADVDLVHIHAVFLHSTWSAVRWCRRYRKPYIINPFGALDPAMVRLKSAFRKQIYIALIERNNIQGAAAIHVDSRSEKEAFLKLGFTAPVIIIPPSLDSTEYAGTDGVGKLSEKYPALQGKKIILFLGRVHPKKGLDLLGYAFKEVLETRKDVMMVIAGPSEGGYARDVSSFFKNIGIERHVLFTGMLLENDKMSALRSSDMFVLPSYGENFGIAVLEAMACKLPVVVTDKVGLWEDIRKHDAGIVTGCDAGEIAAAMRSLLDDEGRRKAMGANGAQLAREKFSSDAIAGDMVKAYQAILGEKK